MALQHKLVTNTKELNSFKEALQNAKLPFSDLNYERQLLISYFENDQFVGTGGIEVLNNVGLLRSISVHQKHQNKKLGTQITESILASAKDKNLDEVYLLTETAKDFFTKLGFTEISRESVPNQIKSTTEFASVCPQSATCMKITLQ